MIQTTGVMRAAARITGLDKFRILLRGAKRTRNATRDSSIRRLKWLNSDVLESEPYRINVSLVQRAGDLSLEDLTNELAQIFRSAARNFHSTQTAAGCSTTFRTGLDELTRLEKDLADLIEDHDQFQTDRPRATTCRSRDEK